MTADTGNMFRFATETTMLALLLLCVIFQLGTALELDLKVSHSEDDDVALTFTFKCSVKEYEQQLAFISLFRQASHENARNRDHIATISVLDPESPFAAVDFQRVDLEGHINSESDSESYLYVAIPDFQAEDLGLYTCEVALVDADGEFTFHSAEARVVANTGESIEETDPVDVTSVPVEEISVPVEETTVPVEETTAPAEETTVPVEETTVPVEETIVPVEETTVPVEETTLPVEETTLPVEETTLPVEETTVPVEETTVPVEETTVPVEETTLPVTESTVTAEETTASILPASLLATVAFLAQRFEELNSSLVAFERKLAYLDKTGDENVTETISESDDGEVISNSFVYENASYLFFKSPQTTNVSRAQTACERRRFYLTEVNDAGELQAIANEISPYIFPEDTVVVAGEKIDQDVWLYQGSQQQVDFFAWDTNEPLQPSDNGCLALRKSEAGLSMAAVPCTSDQGNFYFLCEHED